MASVVAIAVLLGAGAISLFQSERPPEPLAPAVQAPAPRPGPAQQGPSSSGAALPTTSGAGSPAPPFAGGEAPGLAWQVPKDWQVVPSPNSMRVATYRPSSDPDDHDSVEVSVSRAGGSIEANIQRWLGQFNEPDNPRRAEATVHRLPVTFVEMSGTYTGGMMGGVAPAGPRAGYGLVAAIVQTSGSPYFFKMLGPAQKVRAARTAFDSMVESFSPR